jgi:hypothetical protein
MRRWPWRGCEHMSGLVRALSPPPLSLCVCVCVCVCVCARARAHSACVDMLIVRASISSTSCSNVHKRKGGEKVCCLVCHDTEALWVYISSLGICMYASTEYLILAVEVSYGCRILQAMELKRETCLGMLPTTSCAGHSSDRPSGHVPRPL